MAQVLEDINQGQHQQSHVLTVELFATNLRTPSHMEWTLDGRLLVSEHTAGQIKDVTSGGDMGAVRPYASGLEGPASILPLSDGRILVSELWGGRVTDIRGGGDVSDRPAFARELTAPYSLTHLGARIFVVERSGRSTTQITDITAGGGRTGHQPYVTRIPTVPMPGVEGLAPLGSDPYKWMQFTSACGGWTSRLTVEDKEWVLASSSALGQILRVPHEGGDYLDLVDRGCLLADGLGWMGGKKQCLRDGRVYVTQPLIGSVTAVEASGSHDYRFRSPVVRGINMPTCVRFDPTGNSMLVCSMPTGSIWKVTGFA